MKIKIQKTINIEEGKHNGVITNIKYRENPYSYVDLEIQTNAQDEIITLKAGYPMAITIKSMLGKVLSKFGATLEPGQDIDPDEILIGKLCSFNTYNEETKNGNFAKIDPKSVRPRDGIQSKIEGTEIPEEDV